MKNRTDDQLVTRGYRFDRLDRGACQTGLDATLARQIETRKRDLIRELHEYGIERTKRLGAMTVRMMIHDSMELRAVESVLGRAEVDRLVASANGRGRLRLRKARRTG